MVNTKLVTTDFSGAVLAGADLTGAELSDSQLIDADLSHANLTNANLTGANLQGVRGLDTAGTVGEPMVDWPGFNVFCSHALRAACRKTFRSTDYVLRAVELRRSTAQAPLVDG